MVDTQEDVSLTSTLLCPESEKRALDSLKVHGNYQDADTVSHQTLSDTNNIEPRLHSRSDSTNINRLKSLSTGQNLNESMNSNCGISWDTASMKQKLQKAKSISAIDLLQQMRGCHEGVAEVDDQTSDEDIWKWLESRAAADSGRSSPVEQAQDETTLKELIAVSLTKQKFEFQIFVYLP